MTADPAPRRAVTLAVLVALLGSLGPTGVGAHFKLNLNVRVFHVEHREDGLDLYVRTPMPYLVADKAVPSGPDGAPIPAPFTTSATEADVVVHYVAFDQIAAEPLGLGEFLADGLVLETGEAGDAPRSLRAVAVRVHPLESAPPFATLEEALAVFDAPSAGAPESQRVFVGDAVVDVQLRLVSASPVGRYRLASRLDPGLPKQAETANLVLDYGPGGTQVFRARGLLSDPVEVSRSALAAFATFVVEGVRHILEGLDHVIFVLCLVVGASTVAGLLWRVTGFTLGHSVTLALGFFGVVPPGSWFIPAVELTIALTIIYAAVTAIRGRNAESNGYRMFFITSFIGLIHGLGFSFVLQNILKVSSPNIWQSLLAFNVGIEFGQLAIVLVAAGVLALCRRVGVRAERGARVAISGAAVAVASFWIVERVPPLIAAISGAS